MRREIVGILSVLVLLLVLAGFGCGVISVLPDAGPSIWTDKPDYHPEEIVTISGAGFSPGPVALTVTRPDGEINQIPDVSADSSGSFTATYQLDGILGTYIVNATDSAGQTAQTMFTDGLSDVSVGPQVGTLTYGTAGSVTYTITISWSGGGQPATLTITGLPAGASGVFVPSSVSGATTSTLTVSTSSATPAGTHTFTVSASGQSDTGTLTISAACTTYYRDHDGDNYGLTSDSQCLSAPAGEYTATVGGDCDDNDVNEHPGQTWYKDADNDLYSDGITDTTSCTRPAGYKVASELTATSGDCDDNNGNVHPGATEVCNGVDDDCDGNIDEEGATGCTTYYRDDDNDGYGQTGDSKCLCAASDPYDTTTAGDCNDGNAAVHPGATEVCNGADDNCDGQTDEEGATGCNTYYRDDDNDGYGQTGDSKCLCAASDPYDTTTVGDCNDGNAAVHPGATEVCNGIDDNCNGSTDEGVTTTYYRDSDGDGYGDPNDSTQACSQPVGYVANDDDNCPNDPLKTEPGQCGCGVADTDTDLDGTPDCNDGCPTDPLKVAPGVCGCGVADTDSDGDGVADCIDNCPSVSNPTQADSDLDGVGDACDGCPSDPLKTAPGQCGCGVADTDSDSDGTPDCIDNCPSVSNPTQADSDLDGAGDACDGCPTDPLKTAPGVCGCGNPDTDSDGDGVADCIDNCPSLSNPTQTDSDSDGAGDACDGCPTDHNKTAPGQCGCGVADTDTDLDGTLDCNDGCPTDPLKVAPGVCGCGVADTDTDLDGTPDCNDGCPTDPNKINPGVCGCGVADTACGGGGTQGVSEPLRILLLYSTKGGSVTTPGEGAFQYLPGRVVDLVATPDAGYRFVEWTPNVDTTDNVAAAATNITMNGDYAIKANFEEILEYDLTISSTAGRSVTVPGEGTFAYDAGTVVGLVATPAANYRFVNWTGDVDTIANVNATSTTISMNGDYSIIANFAEIPPGQFALTTSSTPGGSVTTLGEGTFTYDEGTLVDLEAEPEEGYLFVNWTGDVDDVADADDASTTITMNDNYSITATFRAVGGCFIATAAYGTPTAEQIDVLREFRDAVLLESTVGSQFVALYYQLSPPVADFISGSSFLRTLVRELLVDPIVWAIEATGDIWRN